METTDVEVDGWTMHSNTSSITVLLVQMTINTPPLMEFAKIKSREPRSSNHSLMFPKVTSAN